MKEASFIKIEQLLPFLLSSFTAFFIAMQIATIIFCKYLSKKDIKITLRDLKGFFLAQIFTFMATMICGIALLKQKDISIYDPMKEAIIATKIAICVLIFINFCYMYFKFLSAKKAFVKNEPIEIEENITIIAYYFIPLNIFLSLLNIYLGIALRDF